MNYAINKNWKEKQICESIRDRFTTGDWSKAAQRNDISGPAEDGEDVYGDFEDLETGEKHESHSKDDPGNGGIQKEDDSAVEERRRKKLALRAKFDAQYPFTFTTSPVLYKHGFFFIIPS